MVIKLLSIIVALTSVSLVNYFVQAGSLKSAIRVMKYHNSFELL
jgi:hypothetical protein